MAGDQYFASAEAINVAAGTPGTIGNSIILGLVSTAAARRMNLNELGVSFNGTSSSATPIIVRLVRITGSVSGGGTATQSPTPLDPAAPSSTFTSYQPTTGTPGVYTTAPTVGVTLRTWYVSPTSGLVLQYPLGQEPDGPATANAGLGIQVIAPATVQANSYQVWTE